MEYTKETTVGDVTTYERYEGTPEEIASLVMRLPQELKVEKTGKCTTPKEFKEGFDSLTEVGYIGPKGVQGIGIIRAIDSHKIAKEILEVLISQEITISVAREILGIVENQLEYNTML